MHLMCLCTNYSIWRWEILLQYVSFYVIFLYEFKIKKSTPIVFLIISPGICDFFSTAVEQMLTEQC